jgi:hypothetical protein
MKNSHIHQSAKPALFQPFSPGKPTAIRIGRNAIFPTSQSSMNGQNDCPDYMTSSFYILYLFISSQLKLWA